LVSISITPVRLRGENPNPRRFAMKYALLIHHGDAATPDSDAWGELSEEEQGQIYADYQALNETPGVTPNEFRLGPPDAATTVRVQDDRTLTTDGPFASVKEAVGGWLVYEADDLDAAIELASRIPAARMGGGVEIRPIVGG
jgi:hypothetical protein